MSEAIYLMYKNIFLKKILKILLIFFKKNYSKECNSFIINQEVLFFKKRNFTKIHRSFIFFVLCLNCVIFETISFFLINDNKLFDYNTNDNILLSL